MNDSHRILIVQGHPDSQSSRLCHALAAAYADGAREAGHLVRTADVAQLQFPLLRDPKDWTEGAVPPALEQVQQDISWCSHVVFFFPLWLGDMPALLKGFLEQVARPGFAFQYPGAEAGRMRKGLGGRSARVVVTMGMPALVYRWFFFAHSVKSLRRNILKFVGISPVHETLIGGVGNLNETAAARWLQRMRRLGQAAR